MKTYVITGATSGIGKALAETLSKGNQVYAGYRNPDKKNELNYNDMTPFYVDYTIPETISKAAEFIMTNTSKIDTLMNVAGCVTAGAVECIPVSELRRQFEVNVFGHIDFTQRLLPLLENGKIINISSMASFGLFPFISPYCASKRALDIMFNSLGLEIKQNTKVISIKPGAISTPIWSKAIEENSQTIKKCEKYFKETRYLIKNAMKNECCGQDVKKVRDKIIRIDSLKNPKPSYCIGFDSVMASFFSHIPQKFLNKMIKFRLNKITD